MKIAVLSDTHNQYDRTERALKLIEPYRVECILHCGDIEDADIVWLFPPNSHFVFGNCDYDRTSLRQAIHGIGATIHEPYGDLELGGVNIAFLHGDDHRLLEELEWMDHFDYIFHGHTHVKAERRRGKTRIINPGALHRVAKKTFAVLDVDSAELVELELP